MLNLLKKLSIDETFTKPVKESKKFNRVKDNIPLVENYNYMADILILPKTKKGFNSLLVVVDLATDEFDIEPLKTKESNDILTAFKKIISRKYVKKPYSSIRTDDGPEFKGSFEKYLKDNDIFHSEALPNRHSQLSSVENLNRTLGRLFNGYMNAKEEKTGKAYNEWTDIVDIVREELNKIRKKPVPEDIVKYNYKFPDTDKKPKFKVGDIVYRQLDHPEDALGNKQPTEKFREGDYRYSRVPKKIVKLLYYTGDVPYRYMLEGIPNASFKASQLMISKEKETKYVVKEIIGKKTINKKIHYLVWWKGYLKKNATYEPRNKLIEDGLKSYIDAFEGK